METKIEKIDKNKINEEIIEEAGMILKNGGLVAFPTETVYGLGADALKEEAAMKTYAAKGRPSDNPLIVHIAEYEDLRKIAVNIPAETDALAAHFWPGPLTMIFEKSEVVPYGTTGGLDTVAVRMLQMKWRERLYGQRADSFLPRAQILREDQVRRWRNMLRKIWAERSI